MQDMSERFGSFLIASLELFAVAFILVIGSVVLWVIVAPFTASALPFAGKGRQDAA